MIYRLAAVLLLFFALPDGCSSSSGSAPQPAKVAVTAVSSVETEAQALDAVGAIPSADLRSLPFSEVELAVHRGWWSVARALIFKSHEVRLDLTAPVRKAVGEVKREADHLMKWLEPSYAHPESTSMAARWSQNSSHISLAARLAPKWEAPGANLAVFSTERGQGHVNPARTVDHVRKLLAVNISNVSVGADIVADTANKRARYGLAISFFDEISPELSSWTVELRRAQGSMQMSTGAQIPELHLHLKKRWLDVAPWPRLAEGPVSMELKDMANTPSEPEAKARGTSVLLCEASGRLFCATADNCVATCEDCPDAVARHSWRPMCIGLPAGSGPAGLVPVEESQAQNDSNASFVDEDLLEGFVGGILQWKCITCYFAEEFVAAVSSTAGPFARGRALGELEPSLTIPNGTSLEELGGQLQIFARNELATLLVASVEVVDRVKPLAPLSLHFVDSDNRRDVVNGTVSMEAPATRKHVAAYELHASITQKDGSLSSLKRLRRLEVGDAKDDTWPALKLQLGPTDVPRHADKLVAYVVGNQDLLSDPLAVPLHDIGSPTLSPLSVSISSDRNKSRGFATFQVTVRQAFCQVDDHRCDGGDHYAIYWGRSGAKSGAPILKIQQVPNKKEVKGQVVDIPVLPNVNGVFAVAVNQYGENRLERHGGVSTPFTDITTAENKGDPA